MNLHIALHDGNSRYQLREYYLQTLGFAGNHLRNTAATAEASPFQRSSEGSSTNTDTAYVKEVHKFRAPSPRSD